MKIDRLILKPLDNNCYIVSNNGDAIIIDPASSEEKIEKFLHDNNLVVKCIFVTHYHFDHVGALDYFVNKYNIPLYDYKTLGKKKIIGLNVDIIPTKGHSMDSCSFYFKDTNDMFVGDFVFKGTIGRTDLEGSDEEEMVYSLRMLRKYPKETKLYPGHDDITTLESELLNNPYL